MNRLVVSWASFILTLLLLSVTAQSKEPVDGSKGHIRGAMGDIFQALTTVVPLSLDEEVFKSVEERERIQQALSRLAQRAKALPKHGQGVTLYFDFLRRSLHQDASKALQRFERGEYDAARFTLNRLTDNCFLCHSRLQDPRPFPLGERFLNEMALEKMPLQEQLKLMVAAREFDLALITCETAFRSRAIPAVQIDLMSLFEYYLRVALRVEGAFDRAIQAFERFQSRPDIPSYLGHYLASWVTALKTLQSYEGSEDELTHVRALISAGNARKRFRADREGLVHFMVASGLLHRYLSTDGRSATQQAEAYYWLGVIESYIPRSSWIAETEFFLETAIRLDPKSSVAKRAYRVLETYVTLGYTGSSGVHVPPEEKARLEELRRLVEGV